MAGTVEPLWIVRGLGAALAAGGLLWASWAWWWLKRAGPRFVDDGPYAFSRHPMYLGLTLTLLGAAPALGLPALALVGLAFASTMQVLVIPHEEARLRRAFGGWYSDYAADVRRWF